MDLANPDSIRLAFHTHRPDIIVNSAAYTAVDKAETDAETAHAVNGLALGIIGEEAAKLGALVIHYSTDYVFDGTKKEAYVETDATRPLSVYGKTKLAGELALAASAANHLIFRTSWGYGAKGANFLKTILRLARDRDELKIVADQCGAPTGAGLIADVTAQTLRKILLEKKNDLSPWGIYHFTAADNTTWHDYARFAVQEALNLGAIFQIRPEKILPISTEEYPVPAPRPANSRLESSKIRQTFDLSLPPWQDGVQAALRLLIPLAASHFFTPLRGEIQESREDKKAASSVSAVSTRPHLPCSWNILSQSAIGALSDHLLLASVF